jgi:hypothetical protein
MGPRSAPRWLGSRINVLMRDIVVEFSRIQAVSLIIC